MAAPKKGTKSRTSTRKASPRRRPSAARGDKSVEAFRNALERSLVLSRERLQEAVDDAVKRGRMTRGDANELVSNLVTRGRQQTDDLMKELERLLERARTDVESRVAPVRKRAEQAAKRAREAAEPALAEADRLRRRAGVGAAPITGYDGLNASQVKSRIKGMKPAELRKVRTQEKRGKARKGVLDAIEKELSKK
jgi:polyhydroxyalkanoate synthesis regulator phasin